jgi:TRAP-type C4-dicarboxylate transport system permease small subunit
MRNLDVESVWGATTHVKRVAALLEKFSVSLALIGLILMMIIVTGNATGRYLFDTAIPGSLLFTERFLMIMVIFLTMARLQAKGENINVDLLYRNFPDEIRSPVDLVGQVFGLLIFAMIVYETSIRAWEGFIGGHWTVGAISFPIYLSWAIVAIGSALLSLRLLIQIGGNLIFISRMLANKISTPKGQK